MKIGLFRIYIVHNFFIYRDQSSGSFVAPEDLDTLAIESFPLCMQEIHSHLRKEHHLRYNARNQYGLFLKV